MKPSTYNPEFCEELIKHMSQGLSFESFAHVAKAGRSTLYLWVDVHPDFKEAKLQGEAAALIFLEKNLILKLTGQKTKIDGFMVQFALRTRFHKIYGEKNQIQILDEDELEFK